MGRDSSVELLSDGSTSVEHAIPTPEVSPYYSMVTSIVGTDFWGSDSSVELLQMALRQ